MDAPATSTEQSGTRTSTWSGGARASEAGARPAPGQSGLADGFVRALESERERLAQVLGGDVAAVATMSRYLIEEALRRIADGRVEEAAESLRAASARIRDVSDKLVALSSELRPHVLDDLGLLPALAWHLRNFGQEHRAILVLPRITVGEREVPVDLKLAVFRMVQAALDNVARHSKASEVRVLLSIFEGELRLAIEDNGVGFNVQRWRRLHPSQHGSGLDLIDRWARASGGLSSLEAVPRHGTRVHVSWRVGAAT
ncbi:MAG: hypothetical protein JO133_11955 [Burkholderiaceae bacterium]|nr:hypothetical protein [Burkholderiaceae bacterium]